MPESQTQDPPSSSTGGNALPLNTSSVLELLHPEGKAIRSLVLGNGCPAMLRPHSPLAADEQVDLFIIAPTGKECRTEGWFQEAIQQLHRRLDSNGVAYLLAPLWWRWQMRRLLSAQDLFIDRDILHLPDLWISRYLVPICPIQIQYVCSNLLPFPSWGRRLTARSVRFFQFHRLLKYFLPSVGMAVRRHGARPLFEWLFKLTPQENPAGNVVIRASWRGRDGAVICYRFCRNDEYPSAVAKIYLTAHTPGTLVREAESLDRLGPSARSAGAYIPRKLSFEQVNEHPVLLQTVIYGEPVFRQLKMQPGRLGDITESLISWLKSWNRATMATRPLSQEFLNREVCAPAALLAPALKQGEEYRTWLMHRCSALTGVPALLVAAHNDLTMWNMMLGKHGHLGIIDWESASEESLPFVDFFYAITDAVTVAQTHGDRSKAFQACFTSGGAYEGMVGQGLESIRRDLTVPDEMVGLCFHACWLHHAANEYRLTDPSDPRPFLQLLQWLLLNRTNLCQWVYG